MNDITYPSLRQPALDKLAAACKAHGGLTMGDYNALQHRVGVNSKGGSCVLWRDGTPSSSLTVSDLIDEHVAKRATQPTVPADQPTAKPATEKVDLTRLFGPTSSPKGAQAFVTTHGIAEYRRLKVQAEAAGLV